MDGENKMQNNEEFFKKIFAGFINSEENKRAWFIDEGIKAYFKNNYPDIKENIVESFLKYHRKRFEELTWSSLICKKCGIEWAFERQKYKEKNNGNSGYICAECSGIEVVKDGMVNVSDEVRMQPYTFIENLTEQEQKSMFIQDVMSMNNIDSNEECVCIDIKETTNRINKEEKINQLNCFLVRDERYVIYFPKIKLDSHNVPICKMSNR